jgi:two-component system, OmpR family, phosphate regulon response regulator OmpR
MSDSRHLLVVDDDDRIRGLLKEYLTRAGFRVTAASDAAGARRMLQALDFDLMILDVMMPGEDGLSLTRAIRADPGPKAQTPILMLTARGMADERIEGLSSGVDDYLPKPFDPHELLLRIEAILRRTGARRERVGQRLTLGQCSFDLARGELLAGGQPVRLTEAEANLLRRLAQTPHVAIDRIELARGAGPIPDVEGGAGRAVDIHVTRLRRKIEADPKNPRYIQTVRGVGYMLAPDEV